MLHAHFNNLFLFLATNRSPSTLRTTLSCVWSAMASSNSSATVRVTSNSLLSKRWSLRITCVKPGCQMNVLLWELTVDACCYLKLESWRVKSTFHRQKTNKTGKLWMQSHLWRVQFVFYHLQPQGIRDLHHNGFTVAYQQYSSKSLYKSVLTYCQLKLKVLHKILGIYNCSYRSLHFLLVAQYMYQAFIYSGQYVIKMLPEDGIKEISLLWNEDWNDAKFHSSFQSKVMSYYCKTSNISRTLESNKIVDNSDVVGASPVGAAPTSSSFST